MITKKLFNNTLCEVAEHLNKLGLITDKDEFTYNNHNIWIRNTETNSEKTFLFGETRNILFAELDAQLDLLKMLHFANK